MKTMRNTQIEIMDDLTITVKAVNGIFEYYIGKYFIFGVEKPFTKDDLTALYLNGYFEEYT